MASGKDVRAGGAFVELFTKNGKLYAGLTAAQNRLKALAGTSRAAGLGLTGIGVGIATPLIAAGFAFAELGSEARDGAQRLGLTTEAFTELKFAAQQSGTSIETLGGGIKLMQKHITEAADGSKTANKTLEGLGLTIDQLRGLSPDEQFELIAEGIANIKNPAERTAAAMEIFGKSGTELITVLAGGSKGIQDMRARARELGLSMSNEDAQAAGTLGDSWQALKDTAGGLVASIGRALAPTFQLAVDWLTNTAAATREWIANNGPLINTIFRIGAVLIVAGGALIAFATATALTSAAIGGLISLGGVIAAVFAAIVSPIGLTILGIGGLTTAFFTLTETGTSTLATLRADFDEVFGGIVDALASGNLLLAAEIVWAGLQLEFSRGWSFLHSGWLTASNATIEVIDNLLTSLRIKLDEWFPGFEQGWSATLAFVNDAWTISINALLNVWDTAFSILKKSLNYLRSLFDSTFDLQVANEAIDRQFTAKVQGRSDAQDKLLDQRDQERRRRNQALAERGTAAVLTEERDQRKKERDAAADDARKTDADRLAAAQERLRTARAQATNERETKRQALEKRTEQGAVEALEGAKQAERKGANAQDIRTAGGLAVLAQAARGGSLQQQMLSFQKKTADQTALANNWNQKNWQQLTKLNDNLPLEATPIDAGGK